MFNNTIKKFAAVGLVFSLCVPCCFASAQKMPPNLFIPSNSGGNRVNQQNLGRFNLSQILNIDEIGSLSGNSDHPQHHPSALERLWTEYGGRDALTVQGRRLGTSQEFVNEVCRLNTPLSVISRGILQHLISGANLSLNDALLLTQEVIAEIYNLDKTKAGRHAMQALADLQAHPILSKFIFK